jgi:hypothetical protein
MSTCGSVKLSFISHSTKISSKWRKDNNVKTRNFEATEEKIGKTLQNICRCNKFLSRTPIA